MTTRIVLESAPRNSLEDKYLPSSTNLGSWPCRFLLHHFCNYTTNTLFPLCSPAFRTSLVQYALSSSPLFNAILASACAHHSRLIRNVSGQDRYNSLYFTNRSVHELLALTRERQSRCWFEMFLTAMVLCTSAICSGNASSSRMHLNGALTLLNLRVHDGDDEATTTDPFYYTVLKWTSSLTILASRDDRTLECLDGLSEPSYGTVDEFTGYSLELMPLLAQIKDLARMCHQQRSCSAPRSDALEKETVLTASLVAQIQDIESNLLGMLNRHVGWSTARHLKAKTLLEMEKCHSIFVYTALIDLYRRVQGLSRNDSKVCHVITECMYLLRGIEQGSTTNILLFWPIFTAGCETNDWVHHTEALARLQALKELGMGCVDTASRIMSDYWFSCSPTGCWDTFSEQNGYDIILF